MVADRRKRTGRGGTQDDDETGLFRGSHPALRRLTERETDVLRLLAAGRSNKEIARALCITSHTVKAHVTRILHKLDVESRTEAAVMYVTSET